MSSLRYAKAAREISQLGKPACSLAEVTQFENEIRLQIRIAHQSRLCFIAASRGRRAKNGGLCSQSGGDAASGNAGCVCFLSLLRRNQGRKPVGPAVPRATPASLPCTSDRPSANAKCSLDGVASALPARRTFSAHVRRSRAFTAELKTGSSRRMGVRRATQKRRCVGGTRGDGSFERPHMRAPCQTPLSRNRYTIPEQVCLHHLKTEMHLRHAQPRRSP